MQHSSNEKLSMLIDDQLDSRQALDLLQQLGQDEPLQRKHRHYQLISQALKHDSCIAADDNFVASVHDKIRNEPAYLLPRQDRSRLDWRRSLGMAAAASVAVVAVLVFVGSEKHIQGQQVAEQQRSPDNVRFKEYLQAHDNTWYVNNGGGSREYTHLAGYRQK